MKKIMILGAGVYQFPLVKYASEHYRVVLIAPEVTDKFHKLVEKVYLLDLRKKEEILEIAKREEIDGIITDQTDIPVRTVAYVAEKLGLPGNNYETACLFTDKNLMRKKLVDLGLPVIPFETVSDLDYAIASANRIGYPVIIKPVDNQGSRGVQKIIDENDMVKKFNSTLSASPSDKVIVEKFITGKEAVVEGLCINKQFQNLIIGDTYYFDIEDAFSAKQRLFPSRLSQDIQKKILDMNKEIIEGFGLYQGITHSEFIIDGNDVYLIETAARGGGVFISSDLINLKTGIISEKVLTDLALGNDVSINREDKDCVCCYIAFYLPYGEVVSLDGIEEVKTLSFVHNNLLDDISIGMKTVRIEDKTSRFSIIVSGKNYSELNDNINYIRNVLNIKVKTVDGIEAPIWQ